MFRQVVAHRWAPGTDDAARAAFRAAMDDLRSIPELVELRYGDDARHFDGNHDFVAVFDFPDFAAARRYVAAEPHQRFIAEHASRVVDARVVVQHDWANGAIAGLHHVSLPVSDIAASREWYSTTLGFRSESSAAAEDLRSGAVLYHPTGHLRLRLLEDLQRARALAGFAVLSLAVGTRADLDEICTRLSLADVPSSSNFAEVRDPDGLVMRLHVLG